MPDKKPILTPLKREEFSENFSAGVDADGLSPLVQFSPLIEQFSKVSPGNFFWFVANTMNGTVHSAGGTPEKITSIRVSDLVNNKPDILFSESHPEDITHLFAFTQHWIQFFMALPSERKPLVHPTIYIRMKNPAQQYAWVMIQYADHIFDTNGHILYGLTLVTDVSQIKKDGVPMMSILDQQDNSCQHFICSNGKAIPDPSSTAQRISAREIEVLRLLAIGQSSKQIASAFNIAVKTIDNHRQSLLRKTNTKSTGELVAWGMNNGYL